jgi:hypothetical protein
MSGVVWKVICPSLEFGAIKPIVTQTFALEDAAEALQDQSKIGPDQQCCIKDLKSCGDGVRFDLMSAVMPVNRSFIADSAAPCR